MEYSFKYYWKVENFIFCNYYCNERLTSPIFTLNAPFKSKWCLYMFPKGWGSESYVGVYLKRIQDSDAREITVSVKFSLLNYMNDVCKKGGRLHREAVTHTFTEDSEWGYNEFAKRSELASLLKSVLYLDTLTILCEFIIKKSDPDNIISCKPRFRNSTDNLKLRNAMTSLFTNKIYTDISFRNGSNDFTANKCILKARVPEMLEVLDSTPDKIFTNNLVTENILLYAYTGKLNFLSLEGLDIERDLDEYGLSNLQQRLQTSSDLWRARTCFCVKNMSFSWKINLNILIHEGMLVSPFISDKPQKLFFIISLIKTDEEDSWQVVVKVICSDDIFVQLKISLGEHRMIQDKFEHVFTRNDSWTCPGIEICEKFAFFSSVDCPFFFQDDIVLDFEFIYPTGEFSSYIELEGLQYDFSLDESLSVDLEKLYYSKYETDVIILAGQKEFRAHKCILSSRSPVFRAMFEHDMREKEENKVELKSFREDLNDDLFATVVDKFLLFIYSGKFDAATEEIAQLLNEMIDMYGIGQDNI